MPINFPDTPTLGDLFTVGARTWEFNGTSWDIVVSEAQIPDSSVTSAKIVDGAIVNADINASASIALSKLATGSSAQVVVANSSGVPTYTSVSGDITISNTGVTAIGSSKVTSDMIVNGTIVNADISDTAQIDSSKVTNWENDQVILAQQIFG